MSEKKIGWMIVEPTRRVFFQICLERGCFYFANEGWRLLLIAKRSGILNLDDLKLIESATSQSELLEILKNIVSRIEEVTCVKLPINLVNRDGFSLN